MWGTRKQSKGKAGSRAEVRVRVRVGAEGNEGVSSELSAAAALGADGSMIPATVQYVCGAALWNGSGETRGPKKKEFRFRFHVVFVLLRYA